MQIVPQIVSTVGASMTVKYSKIGDFLPFSAVFRLGNVKDDSDSILIVVSDRALIRGRGISFNISV